jgi:long-chain acyl-CoA synthetase
MENKKSIIELIENFKKYGKRTAIIHKTDYRTFIYTFSEFARLIEKISAYIQGQGIKKGDKVIIWSSNTPHWCATFIACLKVGIILVPIDYLATSEYVKKIQEKVHAKIIFRSRYKLMPDIAIKEIVMEEFPYILEKYLYDGKNNILNKVEAHDVAEIIFTSGTTGDPKGVLITHENIISNLNSMSKFIRIKKGQRFLSLLPLSHLFEQNPGFLLPLSNGASVVYIQNLKPSAIFSALNKLSITNIVIVPRLLQVLADGINNEVKTKKKEEVFYRITKISRKLPFIARKILFSSIHKKFGGKFNYFVAGGAALTPELQEFWELLGFKVIQGYGMTEASPVITCNTLKNRKFGSVGSCLPEVQVKIGPSDEILVMGKNITKGYYEDEEKTKQLFDDGWMKTGDIGEFDEDGYLYIKGRIKNVIVTSSGMNVYPEDIEKIINSHPLVRESCVLGVNKKEGEEIMAVILPKERISFNIKDIILWANDRLNSSQQITLYELWKDDDFPRTTTMKIKKNVVAERLKSNSTDSLDNDSSKNIEYSKFYYILANITKIPISKIEAGYKLAIDLKLSSIQRTELISYIEQEFNMDINEALITDKTTVKELEDIIKKREKFNGEIKQRRWVYGWPFRLLRIIHNYTFLFLVIKLYSNTTVEGKENIKNIKGPVIFASNHTEYIDTPAIFASLPRRFTNKIATGAHREFFEKKSGDRIYISPFSFAYNYATICMGAYMFPRETQFKSSLVFSGEMIDAGWNILIFPEGKHTTDGKMTDFKEGVGVMATNMGVPVIPIKLEGFYKILNGGLFKRKKCFVKIGRPLYFTNETTPEATAKIKKAIELL